MGDQQLVHDRRLARGRAVTAEMDDDPGLGLKVDQVEEVAETFSMMAGGSVGSW
ncbi:hypothetical protein [Streptomyces sp. SAS_270]|uniref:hypothetical protein n=1 Tax=Streptomyces sp. SAS_270 TaxID=3412748 RepID=UPI00403C913C